MKLSRSRRAFMAALTTLAVLAALELGLRVAGFRFNPDHSYMQFNFPRPNELYQVFEPDPVLLWRMRPGFEFGEGFPPLNGQGFRGPDFRAEKPAGTLRIACLGDSVTFGRPDANFPEALQKTLTEQLGRPVEALNFGVPGYSSYQGLKLLPHVLADYHPDVVIILFGWNDHWLAKGFPDKDQVVSAVKVPPRANPLRRLRLYQFILRAVSIARTGLSAPAPVPRVSPDDYRANLKAMVELCHQSGAQPILATAPSAIASGQVPEFLLSLHFINSASDLGRLHDQYNVIVRNAGLDAPLIDLDQAFQKADLKTLFNDPAKDVVHPNAAGYQLITNELARRLLPERRDGAELPNPDPKNIAD
jgi:lysophospholipase L1-like esterase